MAAAARKDFGRGESLESGCRRLCVPVWIRIESVSLMECARLRTCSHSRRRPPRKTMRHGAIVAPPIRLIAPLTELAPSHSDVARGALRSGAERTTTAGRDAL